MSSATQRVVLVINDDTEAIPPFGVAQAVSVDANGTTHVGRVTRSGMTDVLVNGPNPIPALSEGQMYSGFPAPVYCVSAPNAAASGEIWGTKEGRWGLHSTSTGFIVRSAPDNEGYAIVDRMPYKLDWMVKVTSASSNGAGLSVGVESLVDPGDGSESLGATVLIKDANSEKLKVGRIYHAQLVGLRNRVMTFLSGGGAAPGNSGVDEFGRTIICKEFDEETGFLTDVKIRVRNEDRSVDCIEADLCCIGDWYCVSNEWLTLSAVCCPGGFEITRIVIVRFTLKTGAAVFLPDYALLVYAGDELLWTGGPDGSWMLGKALTEGGVRFECIDVEGGTEEAPTVTPTLFASWDATGFEAVGDASVEAPCILTGSYLDLGLFNYSFTFTNNCGIEAVLLGQVNVEVASWVEP